MLVHKSRGPRGWAGANALKVNGFANPFMEILRHGLKGTQTLDWFVTLICVSTSLTFFCYTTIWCHLAVFKKQLISNVWSIEFIGSINRIAIYVFTAKQTLCDLHSVSYLNFSPTSPSKVQNLEISLMSQTTWAQTDKKIALNNMTTLITRLGKYLREGSKNEE